MAASAVGLVAASVVVCAASSAVEWTGAAVSAAEMPAVVSPAAALALGDVLLICSSLSSSESNFSCLSWASSSNSALLMVGVAKRLAT